MSEPLFQIEDLNYENILFYKSIKILKNKVNFIVGESGSGKSTLLKLLNLSLSAASGTLLYNNIPIATYNPITLRQEVSLVSQEPYLFNESIYENFKTFYAFREQPHPDKEFVKYITNICSINESLDKNALTLSGGERQRIYISIFLSFVPKVILLDEPTSALDEKNSDTMMDNIIKFCKQKSIDLVVISHDKNIVEKFSEHTIELTYKTTKV